MIRRSEIAKKSKPVGDFVAGTIARMRGLSPADCPYALGTSGHDHWFGGWLHRHKELIHERQTL